LSINIDKTEPKSLTLSLRVEGRLVVNESTQFSWSDLNHYLTGTVRISPGPEEAGGANESSRVASRGAGGWGPVLAGGEWKPSWCQSSTRLAVVIPFRDRDSHLKVMLRHLIPILQRQLVHFRIFVVEQVTTCSYIYSFHSLCHILCPNVSIHPLTVLQCNELKV